MKKISLIIILLCLAIQPVNAQELNCKYTYRNGSTGENVKVLQEMLNEKENCNLVVDGKFGSKTASCVRKYQKNNSYCNCSCDNEFLTIVFKNDFVEYLSC